MDEDIYVDDKNHNDDEDRKTIIRNKLLIKIYVRAACFNPYFKIRRVRKLGYTRCRTRDNDNFRS